MSRWDATPPHNEEENQPSVSTPNRVEKDKHHLLISSILSKAEEREKKARQRRFAVMHYLENNTDYFSNSRMLLRDPLSFSEYKAEEGEEHLWDLKPFQIEIDKILAYLDKNPLPLLPVESSNREITSMMKMRFVNGDDLEFFDYDKIDDEERLDKYTERNIEREDEGYFPCCCDSFSFELEFFYDTLEWTGNLNEISNRNLQIDITFGKTKKYVEKMKIKLLDESLEFFLGNHYTTDELLEKLDTWKNDAIKCAKNVKEERINFTSRRFQFLPSEKGEYQENLIGTIKKLSNVCKLKKSVYTRVPNNPNLSLKELTALYIMNNGNSCTTDDLIQKLPDDLINYVLSIPQCPVCNIYTIYGHCLECGIIEFRMVNYEFPRQYDLQCYNDAGEAPVVMWIDTFVKQVEEECLRIDNISSGKRKTQRQERREKYAKRNK